MMWTVQGWTWERGCAHPSKMEGFAWGGAEKWIVSDAPFAPSLRVHHSLSTLAQVPGCSSRRTSRERPAAKSQAASQGALLTLCVAVSLLLPSLPPLPPRILESTSLLSPAYPLSSSLYLFSSLFSSLLSSRYA